MDNLVIGTCSWKYPSWKGLVYSRTSGINYLAEYATRYRSVEIDQWFWSLFANDNPVLPKADTVREYVASVPSDFIFTIKVPNSITLTHHYKKQGSKDLVPNPHFLSVGLFERFLETMRPMEKQVGMLMLQFEYLNRQKMQSQTSFQDQLSAFLKEIPRTSPLAFELRNPGYLNESFFRFLADHDAAPVFLEGYYMPHIMDVYDKVRDIIKGSVVIRLHGTERGAIEEKTGDRWDTIVEPKDEDLGRVAAMIRHLLQRGSHVFLNVNNHYEGSAPLTIEKLKALL